MEWADDAGNRPAAWSYVPIQSYSCSLRVFYKTLQLERTLIISLIIITIIIIPFADDSTVFKTLKTGNNVNHLCNDVNHKLVKLDRWLCANKLSLNVNKSAYSCSFYE